MPKKDVSQLAKHIVDIATGEIPNPKGVNGAQSKGGKIGGPARALKLTSARKKEIALKAINKRWGKK